MNAVHKHMNGFLPPRENDDPFVARLDPMDDYILGNNGPRLEIWGLPGGGHLKIKYDGGINDGSGINGMYIRLKDVNHRGVQRKMRVYGKLSWRRAPGDIEETLQLSLRDSPRSQRMATQIAESLWGACSRANGSLPAVIRARGNKGKARALHGLFCWKAPREFFSRGSHITDDAGRSVAHDDIE